MLYKSEELQGLLNLINKIKSKSFNVATQYKFLKISKAVKEELEILWEQQELLLQEYGEKDEDGMYVINEDGGYRVRADKLQECAAKINELNIRQVQLPDIYFSLDEFEELGFTLEELELLDAFIK